MLRLGNLLQKAKPGLPSLRTVTQYKPGTGKSLSEAFILTSTNPQYDTRLFIDLPVQYMKTASSEHVYINCFECQKKKTKKQTIYVHNMF